MTSNGLDFRFSKGMSELFSAKITSMEMNTVELLKECNSV